jgi:hypothetical protein
MKVETDIIDGIAVSPIGITLYIININIYTFFPFDIGETYCQYQRIWFWRWKSNKRWWKVLCMQIIHLKKSQREPMFNIHEMATMWPMQTLGPDPKSHVSYCHHWASVVCRPPSVRPLTFHILINSSEATWPIWTKLWVCKLFTSKKVRESPCLIFTKWLQCDQCKHWVHLIYSTEKEMYFYAPSAFAYTALFIISYLILFIMLWLIIYC